MKLSAENLTCVRGGRTVFEDLSFELAAGEGLLLTGPNGAGKSSLLRLIAGLVEPASGSLQLSGADAELSIGQSSHFVGHSNAIKGAMSVQENLDFWARFLGGASADSSLDPFALETHAAIPAALLSAGQSRRLALLRLTAVRRPLWLLDEPTVGLDAASLETLVGLMQTHLGDDGLIVAASHVDVGVEFRHHLDLAGRGAGS
jgi:heme exporter protein A